MPFDRAAAKAAGYTDEEIAAYLKTRPQAVPLAPGSTTAARPVSGVPSGATMSPEAAQKVLETRVPLMAGSPGLSMSPADLPALLGQLGSALPGWIGTGAAALGGAVGQTGTEAFRTALGAPPEFGRIPKAAAEQAAGSLIARPIAAVGGAITGRTLQKAAAKTSGIYRAAGRAGARYDPLELLSGFKGLHDEVATLSPKAAKRLGNIAQDFIGNKSSELTPLRVQQIKQLADRASSKIKNAIGKNQLPTPLQDLQTRLYDLVSNNAREMLRRIPGAEAAEAVTKKAIEARGLVPRPLTGPIRPGINNLLGLTEVAQRGITSKPVVQTTGNIATYLPLLLQQLPRTLFGQ